MRWKISHHVTVTIPDRSICRIRVDLLSRRFRDSDHDRFIVPSQAYW